MRFFQRVSVIYLLTNYRKFVVWVFLSLPDWPRIFKSLDFVHPVETAKMDVEKSSHADSQAASRHGVWHGSVPVSKPTPPSALTQSPGHDFSLPTSGGTGGQVKTMNLSSASSLSLPALRGEDAEWE